MILIKNTNADPYFNLAAEEYLLEHGEDDIFMLWRNDSAVIIGKNQNAWAEVNVPFAQENGIKVVRRLTGGGAVFHDAGNVNFTFITDAKSSPCLDFGRFITPVVMALRKMGIDAQMDGRNDITACGGKISGNAQCVYDAADGRRRLMHHGTLLFSADMAALAGVLTPDAKKLASKGIKSVRSRVGNICDIPGYRGPRDADGFEDALFAEIAENDGAVRTLDASQVRGIADLAESKYSTWEWNFGASPACTIERRSRFDWGCVEVRLSLTGGTIQDIEIYGDFFGIGDIGDLCASLRGTRLEYGALTEAEGLSHAGDYIAGASPEDIANLILS